MGIKMTKDEIEEGFENAINCLNAAINVVRDGCVPNINLLLVVEDYLASRGLIGSVPDGDTSDGYHTFNELYEHRHGLFCALTKAHKDRSWKSKSHSDGSMYDGWFIAGIATTLGQATYHLPLRLWDDFQIDELSVAPPWDGHTPDDVIVRIKSLPPAPPAKVDE